MLYNFIKREMLKHPEQIISDGIESITYKELIDYAEIFGKQLTNEKYGILFDSELDTAKVLMACLYANKTAVLLSKKYGEQHTEKTIETVKLSYIITEQGVQKIDDEKPEVEDLSDVALIMCTSGTTGNPKGAMITYENLLTNLKDIAQYFLINKDDKILIARPLYHCAVLTGEFLISLIKGLKIVFFSEGFVPVKILNVAREKNITVLCGTPTLLYHLSLLNIKSKNPICLKNIVVSGECMTKTVATTMRKAFLNANIYNVYGLTEASPRVSYLPPNKFDDYPLSVGIPLNSITAKIHEGELLISGNSIMKGYYADASKTSEIVKGGWLHTGDVAEIDKEGLIYIKCRKDNMIIRGGMNIYPQEIENALKNDMNIEDVLAFGIKDENVSEKIGIKVVTKLSRAEIFNVCKQLLPRYQLPDIIEIVEVIPKNASGKVIRNATNN